MDGQTYIDCEFKNCQLMYSGGELPGFDACQFHGCLWHLDGAARRTFAYLRLLHGTGDKSLAEGIMRQISSR